MKNIVKGKIIMQLGEASHKIKKAEQLACMKALEQIIK